VRKTNFIATTVAGSYVSLVLIAGARSGQNALAPRTQAHRPQPRGRRLHALGYCMRATYTGAHSQARRLAVDVHIDSDLVAYLNRASGRPEIAARRAEQL